MLTCSESAAQKTESEIGTGRGRSTCAKIAGVETAGTRALAWTWLLPAFFAALPAILFYAMLFRQALNLPFYDDYQALLDFLNRMAGLTSASAKASWFFAAQFNEYKLFFGRGVGWLQLALFGHIDFRLLCALGNAFVLLLAILLWKMFLPDEKNLARRVALFVPVPWLLFQLQYAETLDWAMPSLQNLPVLVFSLSAIYLLVRGTWRAFGGALVFLILAIASSGNGLLMIPVGILILALGPRYDPRCGRQYARLVSWLAVSAGCVAAYAYRYSTVGGISPLHHSALSAVARLRPLYVVTFIGNAAAFMVNGQVFMLNVFVCLYLGCALCVFFFAMARRGYIRKNPLVSYCVLFLLLTAIGVAGLRSDFGIAQSVNSRYGIYSALFLIFSWFAVAEEFLQHKSAHLRRNRIWLGAVTVSILFSLTMDIAGWRYLTERHRTLIVGMAAYEHCVSPGPCLGPILQIPVPSAKLASFYAKFEELYGQAPGILKQSIELGIYRPPTMSELSQ